MSFKERKEFEQLTEEIDTLTARKKELDKIFNSGRTIDNINELSAEYTRLTSDLDEKEIRWLELSELS